MHTVLLDRGTAPIQNNNSVRRYDQSSPSLCAYNGKYGQNKNHLLSVASLVFDHTSSIAATFSQSLVYSHRSDYAKVTTIYGRKSVNKFTISLKEMNF